MIGDDIATVLPELREQAASIMRDECTIRTVSAGVWDDVTGTYPEVMTTVYTGPCRVRRPNVQERGAESGDAQWLLLGAVVLVPVDEGTDVPPGAIVTVESCEFDPDLVGRVLTVVSGHAQSHAAARRLRCVEVVRP